VDGRCWRLKMAETELHIVTVRIATHWPLERIKGALLSDERTNTTRAEVLSIAEESDPDEDLRAENERLKGLLSSLTWAPINPEDRPPGFAEARRAICASPKFCFELGDNAPICGQCDFQAVKVLITTACNPTKDQSE
jgi:hypothetical protein